MKRILICILTVLLSVTALSTPAKAAGEPQDLHYQISADYRHLNLMFDSAQDYADTYFTINDTRFAAEWSYLGDYRAYGELDESWFDQNSVISFYGDGQLIYSIDVSLPQLQRADSAPFDLKIRLQTGEDEYLQFMPQTDNQIFFLPTGTDLSKVIFVYDDSVITSLTVTKAINNSGTLEITNGQPADLTTLEGFDCCIADYYRFQYTADGQQKEYVAGLMISENLQSVYFTSDDPENKGREYIESSPDHSLKAKGSIAIYDQQLTQLYSGVVSAIKGRGNTTWNDFAPKKPYQIKLDKKADLLDPQNDKQKAKKWLLLSDPFDNTLMRNDLIMSFARKMGLENTPEGKSIDFYYDGQYRGTYYLCEKVEIGENRVEINDLEADNEDANPDLDFDSLAELEGVNKYDDPIHYVESFNNPENITGGYLLEIDNVYGKFEKSWFKTRGMTIVSKQAEYLSLEEMTYISEYVHEAFDSIYNGGVNRANGKSYTEYFDMYSLVRYFWAQQLGKNLDGFGSSTFFYKPQDEDLLYFGPLWDMDSTMGSRADMPSPTNWRAIGVGLALMNVDDFMQRLTDYYNSDFRPLAETEIFDDSNENGWKARVARINTSAEMNFTLWGQNDANGFFVCRDEYWQNVTDIFTWMKQRIQWFDERLAESTITRISGATRYETATKVADQLKKLYDISKFDTIILADGRNFPDALCSAYLANTLHAPILLINGSSRSTVVKYINKNLAENGKVIVLGGPDAVKESYLTSINGTVERLYGDNRYDTNLEILRSIGTDIKELLVCTGENYADCLSVSALSIPILIVKGDKLKNSQKKYLAGLDLDNIYVIGGSMAVSDEIMESLKEYGKVERISGDDRQKTSLAVAEKFFKDSDRAVLAYANNFPDGLCGGPLASYYNCPVLLAKTSNAKKLKGLFTDNKISKVYVLGGEGLISNDSVKSAFDPAFTPYVIEK